MLCLVVVGTLVSSYPFEVPTSACEDMTPKGPGHENSKPQNSKLPYDFVLERTTIRSSDTVEFTIRGDKVKHFAAFMVQARDDKSATPLKPLGTFQPKDGNARTVTCSAEDVSNFARQIFTIVSCLLYLNCAQSSRFPDSIHLVVVAEINCSYKIWFSRCKCCHN